MGEARAALCLTAATLLLAARAVAQPVPAGESRACVNLGNALEAPSEGEWGYAIDEAHLEAIAKAGFDFVRLPVRWSAHAGREAPYAVDPALIGRVRTVIGQATGRGLGVVVNMHHYDEAIEDPSAHHDRVVGIWRQVGAALSDAPRSVAFEVFNEPRGAMDGDVVGALNAEVLAVIREANPDRQVVLGNAEWNSLGSLATLSLPEDGNLAATFHYYEPFAFTHQGAGWIEDAPPTGRRLDPEADGAVFAEAHAAVAAAKARLGVPILLGEFGAYGPPIEPIERMAYLSVVRQLAERHRLSWCVWSFGSDFAVYDAEAGAFLPGALEALGLAAD